MYRKGHIKVLQWYRRRRQNKQKEKRKKEKLL